MKCPVCGVSRYKRSYNHVYADTMKKKKKTRTRLLSVFILLMTKRKILAVVMWYLPVIDRLKRVFSNPRDAEQVHWHFEKRRENDEEIRYPADGTQWEIFDLQYPEFSVDSRNIRFALSTNGMIPFGENRTVHSTWLVILTVYKIPTWLCHKRMYLMLSILIQGPKQAGIDIDVFLEPLMEDMMKLWNEGGVCGINISRNISC
jgi:hypothetical protein